MPEQSAPLAVTVEPPLAATEILSPEGRFPEVIGKCADYEAFGITEIWPVDPETKEVWTVRAERATPAPDRVTSFPCDEI